MRLTGYDGVTFAALGLTVSASNLGVGPTRSPVLAARRGDSPLYVGVEQDALVVPTSMIVQTQVAIEAAIQTVLGRLDVENPALRTLTCELTDGSKGVAEAAIGSWRRQGVNQIIVDFVIPAGAWRRASPRTSGPMVLTGNAAIALRNEGRKVARPTLDFHWRGAVNRPSVSAAVGYELLIPVTLTNNDDRPLVNTAVQLGPLPTEFYVTNTYMRADGNDLRLFRNGKEVRSEIIAPNSPFTFLWFVPDPLAPGQSATYDLVMGNQSAGARKSLTFSSDPQRPAFDITGAEVFYTSSTVNSVSQSGANWETDQWAGATLLVSDGQRRKVLSNTATTIVVTRAFSSAPAAPDKVVVTKSGYKGDGGICSSATINSLNDSVRSGIGPSFGDNEWKGGTIEITSGTGAGQIRTIRENTQSNIVTTSNWTTVPDATSRYRLVAKNRYLVYDMRQTDRNSSPARGLWTMNQGQSRPSEVRFDAPGSWYRGVYRRNGDSYSQPRAVGANVGGSDVDYFATMNIQRSREGKAGKQEEVGFADSIQFASVFPLISLRSYYLLRNAQLAGDPTKGMCRMLIGVQGAGGDEWDIVEDYGPPANSSIGVLGPWDLTPYGSPRRLLHALVPQEGDEIPDEDNNTAQWQSDPAYPYWAIDVDSSSLAVTDLSSPTAYAIYDVELNLRLGGGLTAAKPYKQLAIGGEAGHVFLRNNEGIRIDTDNLTVEKLGVSGEKLAGLGHLIRPADVITNRYGQTKSLIPDDWLPVPFGENLLANPSFDVDAAGWAFEGATAGITGTGARTTAQDLDDPAAFEFDLTANSAGAGGLYVWNSTAYIPVTPNTLYVIAGWIRSQQATWGAHLRIRWYTSAMGIISDVSAANLVTPISTWLNQATSGVAPSNAAFARVRLVASGIPAATIGKVQFDGLFFGEATSEQLLHVSDPSGAGWGALELSYAMPEGGFF